MRSDAPLPDAAPTNWVDRHAPAALRPWLKLGRFDRPTGIWLLMLPGWMGLALAAAMGGRAPDPVLMLLFFVGAALMSSPSCLTGGPSTPPGSPPSSAAGPAPW